MAVSMRRMNGSWRGLTLALVLCALFLHNGVQGDDPTDPSAAPDTDITDTPSSDTAVLKDATYNPTVTNRVQRVDPTDPSAAPDTDITDTPSSDTAVLKDATYNPTVTNDTATTVTDATAYDTTGNSAPGSDQDTAFSSMVPNSDPLAVGESSGTTAGPGVDTQGTEATDALVVPKTQVLVNPNVECVDKEAVKDKDAVKVELSSETSCLETKRILEDSAWCTGDCNLQVFQEENSNTLVLTRADGGVKELSESLVSEGIKGQLGVVEAAPQWGTHTPIVLVPLLITGLLLAAAIIGCYYMKNNRGHNAKGMRLAEEAYPVDEENHGNTLVSVAPLNPPEILEKPANGDSQEAAKTQPPPTNGHSTTKTADTEL
ncbi:uncharacterized protein [Salmo salar]|uniref:Hematopoietic progenitor cell antigen CD34-like n=1 Tax=Salmo salar TaxID=8030 RepID=A0A1S3MGF6_SALSA|nr:uncharacterized protein LOC106572541 [Salmo salar]|eukprot:XP_014002267.1 PREDICTED: uncharacterized protein LOC106572541 [Salmo salar]